MVKNLEKFAKDKGVKYFMTSFTDLFGGQASAQNLSRRKRSRTCKKKGQVLQVLQLGWT